MTFWTHAAFLVFVAGAVYAQALTGFALALILLGLVGATDVVPLPDAVNATTVMGLCTAWMYLYRNKALRIERTILPTLICSAVGTFVGAFLLVWLAGSAYQALRCILGVSIVACALSLWRAAQPLPAMSSPAVFAFTGAISGLLSGMFSASGPPLVYLLYRQPKPASWARQSLMVIFGLGTGLRLFIIVPSGKFSLNALQLALEALPVVFTITYFAARRPPPMSPRILKALICVLLIATGLGMAVSAISSF